MKEHIKSVKELCEESPEFKACIVSLVRGGKFGTEPDHSRIDLNVERVKGAQLYQRWIGGEYLTHKLAQRF